MKGILKCYGIEDRIEFIDRHNHIGNIKINEELIIFVSNTCRYQESIWS